MTHMQGIVSILGADNHENATKPGSLRRTISADMSSKRWLAQNGFNFSPALKKSEHIAAHDSEEHEKESELNGKGVENPRQLDIWTSILSQKAQDDSSKLPPPYIHPLIKKSTSSLSEKSLKICTESLGSETGSDVFLSCQSSKMKDKEKGHEEEEEEEEMKDCEWEESKVVKNTYLTTKKAQYARSFPPPLPSLATTHMDEPSLHVHSHRTDGRFILEAVSIPSQKYFESQRQDGRFLLTLINNPKENNPSVEFEDVFHIFEDKKSQEDYEEEEEEQEEVDELMISNLNDKDNEILKERASNWTGGVMNVHRSTVMVKRITERGNKHPIWSTKFNNKAVNIKKLELVEKTAAVTPPPPPIIQSLPPATRASGLPPLPPPPTATSFNTYQYLWRAKRTVASVIDPLITQHRPPTKNKAYDNKDLVLLRGNKADCFLPSLIGCKDPRRSLLMWEPYCIATS